MGFGNCLNCGKDISDIAPGAGGKISGTSGDYCNEACWEGHIRGFNKEPAPTQRQPDQSPPLPPGVCPRFAAAQYTKWHMHELQKKLGMTAAVLRESCHAIEVEAMTHYYQPHIDPEAEAVAALADAAIRCWQDALLELMNTIGRAQLTFETARMQIAMNVDVSRPAARRNPESELLTAEQHAALGGLAGPEGGGSES